MTQVNNFITVLPSGYGHNKVTIYLLDGSQLSAVTNRTRLTDNYRSDDDDEREAAKSALIELVLEANGITEYETV